MNLIMSLILLLHLFVSRPPDQTRPDPIISFFVVFIVGCYNVCVYIHAAAESYDTVLLNKFVFFEEERKRNIREGSRCC